MRRFKCTVTHTKEYVIELDDSVLDENWMIDFKQVFYDFHCLEEHAEHIAQFHSRFGSGFIEGYGVPLENGKKPLFTEDNSVNKAINVIKVSSDQCEVEVEEVSEGD